MEHKIIYSRRSGELWTLKCECGRRWHSERWHCEESYSEHLPFYYNTNNGEDGNDGNIAKRFDK